MGDAFKKNWKRVTNVRDEPAILPPDVLRVEDGLSAISGGILGIPPVTVTANASGQLEIGGGLTVIGSGTVGPSGATNEALARWDGVNGNLLQNSNALLTDAGQMTLTAGLIVGADLNLGTNSVINGSWAGSGISVEFGGTGRSGVSLGSLLIGAGTINPLTELSPGSNGQVLTVVAGTPSWAASSGNLSGPGSSLDNALARWDGITGQLLESSNSTLDDAGNVILAGGITATTHSGTWNGNTVGATFGGTSQSTYAQGDILFASAVDTLSRLPAGSNGEFLSLSAGIPEWSPIPSGGGIASGVQGPSTSTDNAIVLWDGTTGDMIKDSNVTIVADIISGGTWQGTVISQGFGGTAQSSWNSGEMLAADDVGVLGKISPGTETQVLTIVSGLPDWADAPAGADGSGVGGPGSSTDDAVVRWDGITGQTIQNSNATLNDAGDLSLAGDLSASSGSLSVLNVAGIAELSSTIVLSSITNFTSSPVTVLDTDYVAAIDVSAAPVAVAIFLPSSPVNGQRHEIKDAGGTASGDPMTLFATGGASIDTFGSIIIANAFQSVTVIFNASLTRWHLI